MSRVVRLQLLQIAMLAGLLIAVCPAAAMPLCDAPYFGPATFSLDFDPQTQTPVGADITFGSDTVSLYVSFEYDGVVPGTEFQGTWYLNGEPFTERTGAFTQEFGTMENSIGTTDGLPLPEGTYGFGFEAAGEPVLYEECVVGGVPEPLPPDYSDGSLPTFGDVYVTDAFDDELEMPVGSAEQFGYGVTTLYFYCDFTNVPIGAYGISTSYHDQEFLFQTDTSFDFSDGSWWETVENPDGSPLAPGTYSVVFEVDGRPTAMGECIVGDAAPPPPPDAATAVPLPAASTATMVVPPAPAPPTVRPVRRVTPVPVASGPAISPITFALDVTDDGTVVGAADIFPAGTTAVWAYFTFTGMRDGMAWGRRWEEHGELFAESLDLTWEYGEEGWLSVLITDDPAALVGEYTLTLYVDGQTLREGRFTVAQEGAVEPPPPGPVTGDTPAPGPWQGGGPTATAEGTAASVPTFAAIQFTTEFDANAGRPVGAATAFKPGIDRFYVYADWHGAQPDTSVLVGATYYNPLTDDESLIYLNEVTLQAESGTWWEEIYDIQRESTLLPGLYRVSLSTDSADLLSAQIMISPDVAAAAQFYSSEVLSGSDSSAPIETPAATPAPIPAATEPPAPTDEPVVMPPMLAVGPVQFSAEFDRDTLQLGALATDFPLGTEEVYARFEYEGLPANGTRWSETTVSSAELGEDVFVCDHSKDYGSESGTWTEIIAMHDGGTLPAGNYRVEFSIVDGDGSRLIQVGTFTVAGGG